MRAFFQRYFIPYDKMELFSEKGDFSSKHFLIQSDLPGVPSRIRFQGFGMKKVLKTINERRERYIAKGPAGNDDFTDPLMPPPA